jgi:hypothetical protein
MMGRGSQMEIFSSEVWRHAAGHLRDEGLPWIAAEALARGIDSPALRELAGLNQREDPCEIRDLYEVALEQLGVHAPTYEEATRRQLRNVAKALASGELTDAEVRRFHLVGGGEDWMTSAEFTLADLVSDPDDFPYAYPLSYPPEGFADYAEAVRIAARLVVADTAGTQ